MSKSRIVIDITTLQKWRRFPVGIVRTQLEFTKYCIVNISNCGFVAFDDSKSVLKNVERNEVLSLLKDYELESWQAVETNSPTLDKVGMLTYLKIVFSLIRKKEYMQLTKSIYRKTPTRVRGILRKYLEPIFRSRIEISSNKKGSISSSLFSPESHLALQNEKLLDKNDILICMGLDWDFSNYSLLYEMKKNSNFQVVTCFYDSIPISYPELVHSDYFGKVFFSHMYKLNYLSDKVFCISDFSKKSYENIAKETHFSSIPNLRTIYLGDDINKVDLIDNGNKDKGHILYVSTIEARKNHILLLNVWNMLISKYGEKTPKLILVGMKGWGVDDFYELYSHDENLKKYVDIRSNVSDYQLSLLYKNSQFCVFPSIVEGWGLGAAESLSYGKACLVSDCEALSEATQSLMPALPNDSQAWFDQITKLIDEPENLIELQEKVEKNFKPRSWNDFCTDFHNYILEAK
ncbi:glycosyltransferase [Vibrio sp. 10N.261.54.A5]|uniref:glycosyltransferase n=1 Tax=Vibrio sp. 10N.261.54.A5 TaxID=3229686 RepID=UPI00354D5875